MTVGVTRTVARMADNRPSRYVEDGVVVYRASALGSCMKALVALGLGHAGTNFPDWLYERFQEGIDGEPWVINKLRENWRIMDPREGHQHQWHDDQLYVEIPVGQHIIIRGHADGIGTCFLAPVYEDGYGETEWHTGDKRLIEVKCATEDNTTVVLRTLPSLYAWQISVYGGFFHLPVMLAIGVKDQQTRELVNVVTQMWDELPYSMSQIKMRVMEIEQWIAKEELPNCDHKQWPCPYQWLCDNVIGERTPDDMIEQRLAESIVMVQQRKERGASG